MELLSQNSVEELVCPWSEERVQS